MKTVNDIRNTLIQKYQDSDFIQDRSGAQTIEIVGESFEADEDYIVREPNQEYIDRELQWYMSESLYVDDIPGKTPKIWDNVSSIDGKINSNYGWCIFSEENHDQYNNVFSELKTNPWSRRATMIYNRPSMHYDYCTGGMQDFMCTFANTFFIRNGLLVSHYIMRSNDAVFGYNNDVAWAKHIHSLLADDLGIPKGKLIWTASSFHVYERHFKYLDDYIIE